MQKLEKLEQSKPNLAFDTSKDSKGTCATRVSRIIKTSTWGCHGVDIRGVNKNIKKLRTRKKSIPLDSKRPVSRTLFKFR